MTFAYLPQDLPRIKDDGFPLVPNPEYNPGSADSRMRQHYLPTLLHGMRREEEILARLLQRWQEAGDWAGITIDDFVEMVTTGPRTLLRNSSMQEVKRALGWLTGVTRDLTISTVPMEHGDHAYLHIEHEEDQAVIYPTPLLLKKLAELFGR